MNVYIYKMRLIYKRTILQYTTIIRLSTFCITNSASSSGNNAYLAIVKCFVEICYFVDDATMFEKVSLLFSVDSIFSIKQKRKMNASLVTFVKEFREKKRFFVEMRDIFMFDWNWHIHTYNTYRYHIFINIEWLESKVLKFNLFSQVMDKKFLFNSCFVSQSNP